MEILIAIVLLCALGWFASAPLRRSNEEIELAEGGEDPDRADLEALKEATYRQIRDAEIDHKQGKLSDRDWERTDSELRSEAIELLKRLDKLEKAEGAPGAEAEPPQRPEA